ncbi:MAG: NUDIX domain-containing protein [bacterium]
MNLKKHIEILVRGVCVKEGKMLVCQGKGAANTYLPGGHVEWQEKATDSLKREMAEELGVKAVVKEFLGAVEHTFIQKGERHCEINLVFSMDIPALSPGKKPEACEDWITFKWIPLTALGRNHLEPYPLRTLIPAWVKPHHLMPRWGSTLLRDGY